MNDGNRALVSIVIPCHNEEQFIGETIDSALSQAYAPIEVIVVDDGSQDGSRRVIQSHGPDVQLVCQAWSGAPAARNRGANRARGDFVMFLDGDDVIAPDTIGALVEVLKGLTDTLAACKWGLLSPCCEGKWRVTGAPHDPPLSDDPLLEWLEGRFVPPCSLLWPMRVFRRTGGWDETLAAGQDGDLVFRALLSGVRLQVASEGYALYRQDSSKRRISTALGTNVFSSRVRVFDRVRTQLLERSQLERYMSALGRAYYYLGVHYFTVDSTEAHECAATGRLLGGRDSVPGGILMRAIDRALGLRGVVAAWRARLAAGTVLKKLGLRGRCDGQCSDRVRL